jgi:phosphoribosylaminoimidazole-succinocarboxamide synthase
VKLEHATYGFGAIESMEIALIEFLLKDEQRKAPLMSPQSRNDLLSRSSGYVALLGSYAACKLNGVVTKQETSQGSR